MLVSGGKKGSLDGTLEHSTSLSTDLSITVEAELSFLPGLG